MKSIGTKVRKNRRKEIYTKFKRNLQRNLTYQTESLNTKELSG